MSFRLMVFSIVMFFCSVMPAYGYEDMEPAPVVAVSNPLDYLRGPYTQDPYIREFFTDAVKYWGGLPEHCATPDYNGVVDGITITNTSEYSSSMMHDPHNAGYARIFGCKMAINDLNGFWPSDDASGYVTVCNIVTHELGHNFGYDHVEDKTDIMFADIQDENPHCDRWLSQELELIETISQEESDSSRNTISKKSKDRLKKKSSNKKKKSSAKNKKSSKKKKKSKKKSKSSKKKSSKKR